MTEAPSTQKAGTAPPRYPAVNVSALLRKACELRVLGYIWEHERRAAIGVRFVGIQQYPFRCLVVSPEIAVGRKLRRGGVQKLSFRVGGSQYSCTSRILFKLPGRLLCALPKEVKYHQMRKQMRVTVYPEHKVQCDFGADWPRFTAGDRHRERPPLSVIDVSFGGVRIKMQQTKQALPLSIGERFTQVTFTGSFPAESVTLVSVLELSNIMVREEWSEGEETHLPVRTRTTYLGFCFVDLTADAASGIQRLVHAVSRQQPA